MNTYQLDQFGTLDGLARHERSMPQPTANQVLVKVHARSLNFRDLTVVRGGYGRAVKAPLIPLSDGAGEVLSVGTGVTRVKPGDRVAAIFMQQWIDGDVDDLKSASALGGAIDGILTERVCLKADGLVRFPDHLTFEEAAALPCATSMRSTTTAPCSIA